MSVFEVSSRDLLQSDSSGYDSYQRIYSDLIKMQIPMTLFQSRSPCETKAQVMAEEKMKNVICSGVDISNSSN